MTTLLQRVKDRITRTTSRPVFVRSDFNNLGGYDQIGRALSALTKDGVVLKMGYGIYVDFANFHNLSSPYTHRSTQSQLSMTLITIL